MEKIKSPGDRGKFAEKQVADVLDRFNDEYVTFAFERLPDARAARGRLKRQLSDFIVESNGVFYPFEVKETGHDFRLTKDKIEQLPRLKKWRLAGARPVVMIYHSNLGQWRLPHFDVFLPTPVPPSWNLIDEPLYDSAEEAMRVAFCLSR